MIRSHSLYGAVAAALLGVLCGAGISGCGSSSTGPDTGTPSTAPKTGSTYTMESYNIDSSGNKLGTAVTGDILVTGTTDYAGKQNVTMFGAGNVLEYLVYESNGDVSVFVPSKTQNGVTYRSGWATYPFGGKGEHTLTLFDSTYITQGITGILKSTWSSKYLGSEEITVGTEKLMTLKVQTESIAINQFGNAGGAGRTTSTEWYAPSIGYWVRQEGRQYLDVTGAGSQFVFGFRKNLISYSLK